MPSRTAPVRDTLDHLGDFTATPRLVGISALAIAIGACASVVAAALLALISLFTNLFFYQRFALAPASPAGHHLGPFVVMVPVAGALIIGAMARFGSERIRGHGIPEAIEAILINGSRVEPKVAVLKPLSAAISIGSGGPFGAEGPIIMTGGALGSLIAQFFRLTSAERKTLLVSGAAAGMSATFAAPVASVVLAVELLLFEWKPRSVVPVALASVTAGAARRYLLGAGPVFPVHPHAAVIGIVALIACAVAGLLAGVASALLTQAVYAAEDLFAHLPIHWMWWPAIGGLGIGLGGLVFPRALGVGYDVIGDLLQGDASMTLIAGVLLVKSAIWAFSLGSGTSGGVLAPLLMMGAALGALESHAFPQVDAGFWPLIGMAAMLGGTMRAPLTAVVFALELTHDVNVLLPLLLAASTAHAFTVLTLRRSILTEKVSRRGFHLSREYAVDPLEIIFAREVARSSVAALPASATKASVSAVLRHDTTAQHEQRLFPIVDDGGGLLGVVTRRQLRDWLERDEAPTTLGEIALPRTVIAYADEPLRIVAYRMAESAVTRVPVVSRGDGTFVGMIALRDLLSARGKILEAEQRRERMFAVRWRFPGLGRDSESAA
ncbi:MAG: chloride channel protein [Acidobacteria bacterium]|nr:chloride channel protein [Acidobacteriota bacterium]